MKLHYHIWEHAVREGKPVLEKDGLPFIRESSALAFRLDITRDKVRECTEDCRPRMVNE